MFKDTHAFASFSVDDLDAAQHFYGETLGLRLAVEDGMMMIDIAGGGNVLVYPKGEGHEPATFTVLNLPVDDIDAAVDALKAKGIAFEHYDDASIRTDARGIARDSLGPAIAWFKDPAGNIISVLQDKR